MLKWLLAAFLTVGLCGSAYAQSTATPVVTGYLTTVGCPYGQTTCFVQFGPSGGTGGSTNATIVGPLSSQAPSASVSVTPDTTTSITLTPSTVTPCPSVTTANCSLAALLQLLTQTAAGPILVGPGSGTALIQATASVPITNTAAATTQLVALSGSKVIYVTHYHLIVSGAGTWALIAGTGSTCGSNTTYLEGQASHPLSAAANGGISAGSGLGPILITPAGYALCIVTTGSVDTSGALSYAQF